MIPINAENRMLLANIIASIKTKSPAAMHRSAISSNTIEYYNYLKKYINP
jgi:hypothetical protein